MSGEDHETRKTGRTGCGAVSFLFGAVAIAAGVYLMGRWEALPAPGRAGSIVLVVLGTILVLPLLLMLALKLFFKVMFRRLARQLAKAGNEMIEQNRAMYGKIHEYRSATSDDFDSLDVDYYETRTRDLTDRGYRHLGDVIDETLEELGQPSPPIRILSSPDGSTGVAIYHLKPPVTPPQAGDKPLLMCDVSTEFTDGTQLITSNTAELDLMTAPPQLYKRQHPLDTPIFELLRLHEAEKSKLLAAKAGATCVTINTLEEALESEKRQQEIKNAFRKEIGYIDPEEVRRIAGTVSDDDEVAELGARVADEARKQED